MNYSAARAKAQNLRRQIRKGKYVHIPVSPADKEIDAEALAGDIRQIVRSGMGDAYELIRPDGRKETLNMHRADDLITSALMNGMKPELRG